VILIIVQTVSSLLLGFYIGSNTVAQVIIGLFVIPTLVCIVFFSYNGIRLWLVMRRFSSLTTTQQQLRTVSFLIVTITLSLALMIAGFLMLSVAAPSVEFYWFRYFIIFLSGIIISLSQILVFQVPTSGKLSHSSSKVTDGTAQHKSTATNIEPSTTVVAGGAAANNIVD
jgi:hypothetical protein